jgi:hypothetical protein
VLFGPDGLPRRSGAQAGAGVLTQFVIARSPALRGDEATEAEGRQLDIHLTGSPSPSAAASAVAEAMADRSEDKVSPFCWPAERGSR